MKKLTLLLAFPLISSSFYIKYNYQPGKNNFEVLNQRELNSVLEKLNAVEDYNCTDKGCYVYLKPLLGDINFEGFSIFAAERIRNYLALKEGFRYSEKQLLDTAKTTVFFLKNNGYLDASAKTEVILQKKGIAKVNVKVKTGELYLWGGFNFVGACFKPEEFYEAYGKPFGTPFRYSKVYEALDLSYEFCRKSGYYRSFVYLKEPFEVKRRRLLTYFGKNLSIKISYALNFLSEYLNILIQNPYKGIKFLFQKAYAVVPEVVINKGDKLQIKISGNQFFKKEELLNKVQNFVSENYFLSTALLAKYLTNLYKSYGFFDVFITIYREKENEITIKIKEGKRYKLDIKIKPNIGFQIDAYRGDFFSGKIVAELRKKIAEFLKEKNFYYKSIEVSTKINRTKKKVELLINVVGLEPFTIEVEKKLDIGDKGLRSYVEDFIENVDYRSLVGNKEAIKNIRTNLKNSLMDYGCINPQVEFKSKHPKKGIFLFYWNVSCKDYRRISKVVYWIDGRIRKRELNYMIPECLFNKKSSPKYVDILTSHWQKTELFQSLTVKKIHTGKGRDILLIEGVERRPFNLSGTLGYETDQGFFSDIELYMFDLLKTGEKFKLRWNISQKRNLYEFSYLDNYFFSERLFAGFNIFKKYEEHNAYKLTAKGLSLTFGYHLNLYTDVSLNLVNTDIHLEENTERDFNVKKINGIANFYYPIYRGLIKRGVFAFNVQGGFNFNEPHYAKLEGKLGLSYNFNRLYIEWKTSAGWVDKKAPIFEKFFLGGINNLKGYTYESVAPAGGGEIYWYAGLEMGIPIFKKGPYLFGGADFGNSVKHNQNPFGEIKKDIFLGVGVLTKVGPIRGGLALPLEDKVSFKDVKPFLLVGFSF